MVDRWLADAVVILHFAFVAFVMVGGLLVLRWRWIAWLHVPALIWGALVEFMHWICPLTYLEDWLREQAGIAAYHDDFIAHYLLPILYPAHLTAHIQIALGVAVIVINMIIYVALIAHLKRRHRP